MRRSRAAALGGLWRAHDSAWRDPAQVASQWYEAASVDPSLLQRTAQGGWWDVLAARRVTLLVTREYEHLIVALRAGARGPAVSYMPLPHPSGLAVDRRRATVHVASTRNPNVVFDLAPVTNLLVSGPARREAVDDRPLVPVRARYFPGCLYLHDLALVGGVLHANAVGHNAVVRLQADGRYAAGVVAALHRLERRPALRAQLSAAQLHRRRIDAAVLLLQRLGGAPVHPPTRAPELPGRWARRGLLGRQPRTDRARAHPTAFGPPASGPRVGLQQRLWRAGLHRSRARSFPSPACPAGRAACASPAPWLSSAPRASCHASAPTRRVWTWTPASAASTRSTRVPVRSSAAYAGRGATRSSPSRRCPARLTTGFPFVADAKRATNRERAIYYSFVTGSGRRRGGAA